MLLSSRFYCVPLLSLAALFLSGCGGSSSSSLATAAPIIPTAPVTPTPPVTTLAPVVGHYAVLPLGLLPGFTYSSGTAINSQGQVTGLCEQGTTASSATHAFLYTNGISHDLGLPAGYTAGAGAGIDDAGDVVVNGTNADASGASALDHPFLYTNGTYSSLAAPLGSLARALISSKGENRWHQPNFPCPLFAFSGKRWKRKKPWRSSGLYEL